MKAKLIPGKAVIVEVEPDDVKVYGYVRKDALINNLTGLSITDDGMVKIVDVMHLIEDCDI